MESNENLKITSIEDLRRMSNGEIVSLPPFVKGTEFNARLKRPSMLAMVKSGRIDNELLVSANELFSSGASGMASSNVKDASMMKKMFDVIDCICEDSFVEPTYNDLKSNKIELTDEQLLFIFSYAQTGVKELKSFR